MKRLKYYIPVICFISCVILVSTSGLADDTCMFMSTADDVPPNIVILLDNGAEMEQITWLTNPCDPDDPTCDPNDPAYYYNSIDYTPNAAEQDKKDVVVAYPDTGNGFFNENGYSIYCTGGKYYLVPIGDDMEPNTDVRFEETGGSGSATWTIKTKTVTLPAAPSTAVDAAGIKDNAQRFRYSKNYLNWIFFSGKYAGNGSDLPDKSRFYQAKKAILNVAKLTSNQANFALFNFASNYNGAQNVQPVGPVVETVVEGDPTQNTLEPNFINNVNNMGTVTYSPLAEGLSTVGYYYSSSSTSGYVVSQYCQKNFALVVSPGVSSEDLGNIASQVPAWSAADSPPPDYDLDNAADGIGEGNIKEDSTNDGIDNDDDGTTDEADEAETLTIATQQNGSTYLDDVTHYLYTNDIVGYRDGFQNVITYTVGLMPDRPNNLFLINTSNNGNGNVNLYDTGDPEYGKYHFTAESPDALSSTLLAAINTIISQTSSFTAPVVPVTRTTSGNRIYMAFFKPNEGNFWEGNVTKFGISSTNQIVDKNDNPATYDNGAIINTAEAYWETKHWADSTKDNYIHNSNRNIYTYLGSSTVLTDSTNEFKSTNAALTATVLGNPTQTTAQIINYVRGADVFDADGDSNTSENRQIITGDVLHSEPVVVSYNASTTMVYFAANDGMLHAVTDSNGTEAWAFIPTDLLPRLKDIVEGAGHQYFVDGSPRAFIKDVNDDGEIESADGDKVIIVCGEREGGTAYFALDVTSPSAPNLLWGIHSSFVPELGETWSEPQFGLVKTTEDDTDPGTNVLFIGGGYSSTNTTGKAILAIDVETGNEVRTFSGVTGMDYSFASSVCILDSDSNGFVDRLYVGDLGGQMWRFAGFSSSCPDNINNWTAQIIFDASDTTNTRKFFYPPSITFEVGYDLVFMGTGDRENACSTSSADRIYCVKDDHGTSTTYPLTESDPELVNVTNPTATLPDLDGSAHGWYIELAAGEKVLAEGTVFYKAYYVTTFTPNNDPCLPGGIGKLYALGYKTGAAVLDFDGDDTKDRSVSLGGGIPSKPVMVITETGQKLFISVGSTNPDPTSESFEAGIVAVDPLAPPINLFYLWWREL